jgi:hypothetical protein
VEEEKEVKGLDGPGVSGFRRPPMEGGGKSRVNRTSLLSDKS